MRRILIKASLNQSYTSILATLAASCSEGGRPAFLFLLRSEKSKFRIFSGPSGAAHHHNTRCSGLVSCCSYQMLCLPPHSVTVAARRKTALCSGRNRATLPESCEYTKNRITMKPPSGNLMTWLYGCLLSG